MRVSHSLLEHRPRKGEVFFQTSIYNCPTMKPFTAYEWDFPDYFWQFPAMVIFLPSSQTSWTSHSANGTGNSKLIWPWTFQIFSECFQIFVFSYFPSEFFFFKKCNFQPLDGNRNVWNDFDVDDYGLSDGFIPIRPVKN